MQEVKKVFAIRRGRYGFNGNVLAGMNLKEAQAYFKSVDPRLVKDAHAEAVKIQKENDKDSKEKK